MAPRSRTLISVVASVLLGTTSVLGLSACSSDVTGVLPGDGVALTIGSRSGFENRVVAQLYGQALADQGYTVDYNTGVGARRSFLASLEEGVVDLVPDYAGSLLSVANAESSAASSEEVLTALPLALEDYGVQVLAASAAEKKRVFVVRREFAEVHGIESIGDLRPIGAALTIGSSDGLDNSSHGRRALEFAYGISGWLSRSVSSDEVVLSDLLENTIQVAELSSLDPGIRANDLVVLTDPEHIVVAQNLVPVVRAPLVTGALPSIVDAVSSRLTTADLTGFTQQTDALPATVATRWLRSQQLLDD